VFINRRIYFNQRVIIWPPSNVRSNERISFRTNRGGPVNIPPYREIGFVAPKNKNTDVASSPPVEYFFPNTFIVPSNSPRTAATGIREPVNWVANVEQLVKQSFNLLALRIRLDASKYRTESICRLCHRPL